MGICLGCLSLLRRLRRRVCCRWWVVSFIWLMGVGRIGRKGRGIEVARFLDAFARSFYALARSSETVARLFYALVRSLETVARSLYALARSLETVARLLYALARSLETVARSFYALDDTFFERVLFVDKCMVL